MKKRKEKLGEASISKEEDETEVVQLIGVDLQRSSGEVEGAQWWGRRGSSSMALVERERVGVSEGVRESRGGGSQV